MIPKRDKSFLVPNFICIVSLSLLFIVRPVLFYQTLSIDVLYRKSMMASKIIVIRFLSIGLHVCFLSYGFVTGQVTPSFIYH